MLLVSEQRLLRILRGEGNDRIRQFHLPTPAPYSSNVPEVAAMVIFERLHFNFVVRGHSPLPVQPGLPAIGHGIGEVNRQYACPFPLPTPPTRGMQTP